MEQYLRSTNKEGSSFVLHRLIIGYTCGPGRIANFMTTAIFKLAPKKHYVTGFLIINHRGYAYWCLYDVSALAARSILKCVNLSLEENIISNIHC